MEKQGGLVILAGWKFTHGRVLWAWLISGIKELCWEYRENER